jgi:hypothetical protein
MAQSWFGLGSGASDANIVLTGSYRLLGQTSNRQGTFQQKPPDFARAEFTPTLLVFGIPLSATVLFSTEQGSTRQNINAVSLSLDPEVLQRIVEQRAYRALDEFLVSDSGSALQQIREDASNVQDGVTQVQGRLADYQRLQELRERGGAITDYADALENLGILSGREAIMLWMPKIGYGTVFPSMTQLTLQGSRVNGLDVEWNPGRTFYLHFVRGTTQRPLVRTDGVRIDTTLYTLTDIADYGRQITAARVGVGSRDGEHFTVSGVYTTDDPASLPRVDSLAGAPPQRNIVGSMDFRIEPIRNVWSINAELAGSVTVGDLLAPRITTNAVPAALLKLIDSSSSTYADWSAFASTNLSIVESGTRFSASIRRIGTGYRALGVPNMRVDVVRYDARIDQGLFKRQLTLGVFIRRDHDNLVPLKRATTLTTSMGASIGIVPRSLPYLRVSYMPYVQESNTTDSLFAYANRTQMWNATSGYSYRIGDMGASTQLAYALQQSVTTAQMSDYSVQSINMYQSLSFVFPLNITFGGGIIEQRSESASTAVVTGDVSGSYSIDDVLSVNAGLTLALDQQAGDRIGYSVGVAARIGDIAEIDLRAERSVFDERMLPPVLGGSYREGIIRLVVSKSW